jgi:hypothetical protein
MVWARLERAHPGVDPDPRFLRCLVVGLSPIIITSFAANLGQSQVTLIMGMSVTAADRRQEIPWPLRCFINGSNPVSLEMIRK